MYQNCKLIEKNLDHFFAKQFKKTFKKLNRNLESMNNSLIILYLNIQSIASKVSQLQIESIKFKIQPRTK